MGILLFVVAAILVILGILKLVALTPTAIVIGLLLIGVGLAVAGYANRNGASWW